MPIPVKRSCSTRSMNVPANSGRERKAASQGSRFKSSIVDFDMLVEDDRPLLVPPDVVAVQAVAVLVEIVFALGTREFLQTKNGLADLAGVGRARLVDRCRKNGHGIVG